MNELVREARAGLRQLLQDQSQIFSGANMRLALVIAGVVLILVGAVWIGQGTGYFPYPASSFMIDDS